MNDEHSMDKAFIKKLTDIIEVNLNNEQFGVKELAEEIGISRSQLHRKLHSITRKSTSQFIREYRLQKSMKMLQNNVATVSEIAYRIGFSSPTYFNTCFREYYGYPPGEVKFRKSPRPKRTSSKKRLILISSLSIVILFLISYFFYLSSMEGSVSKNTDIEIKDKSIAMLPIKNLSDEQTNQYFADGVMDVILNHLSSIKDFKVISRTSMEQYREIPKTAPKIAEEMGISYILEASVQKYGDKIRIIVQLIDARKDQHLWSGDFEREFNDIFTLQSDIAKQIAKELKTALSPVELERIEKKPTKNLEAYNLYLKGRYFWNKKTKKDVKSSIKYFEQSIEKDPEYASAYAGLADAYLSLTREGFFPKREGTVKIKELALKSISLDNTVAEAHATLGMLACGIEWNWEDTEKELKLAFKLNPNYATTYLYYAHYLHILGRYDESREQINQALFLDPLSYEANLCSAFYYFREGLYDKALMETGKAQELNKNDTNPYWINFNIYVKQKKNRKAVEELQKIMRMDTLTLKHAKAIGVIYEQSGIKGVFQWLIDYDLTLQDYNRPFFLAQKYAFIGEKDKALALLELAFEMKVPIIPFNIKNNFYFENLYSEPRFKALLNKIGL